MKKIIDLIDRIRIFCLVIFLNPQALGMGLAALLVYLIFEKSPASEKEVQNYIQNSDTVVFGSFKFVDYKRRKHYARSYFRKINSNIFRSKEYAIIKDLKTHKYFELGFYGGGIFMDTAIFAEIGRIYGVINTQDLNNPKLGTKKKPVHILLFYTNKGHEFNEIPKHLYRNSVKEFLTYEH